MLTIAEIIQAEKAKIAHRRPSDEELRRLDLNRVARIFGRLSDPKQIQESLQSMAELIDLVKLAQEDGFRTELSEDEVSRRIRAIQKGELQALRYWRDGQIIVDLRDLGVSGRLGPEKRAALAELMTDLSRGEIPEVTGVIYLSSEGMSRLSRDQDYIVGPQLLKLMKQANCRVRTPYRIFNPRIESDWKELREGFEDAAKESRHLQKDHFGPRKRGKALKGEHVGNQVPPGFIVAIKSYKSNGSFIFGKWQRYEPHIPIVIRVLQEYIRCGGSKYKAAQALRGVTFPFFPEELKYMETRSTLRNSLKTADGYLISPEMIEGLASQLALIGTWKWTDIIIEHNHPAIVPLDLFQEAYALAVSRGGKPKGRAAYFEPLDWDGLLWCYNHATPYRLSGHASEGKWVCDRDYHNALGPVCLDIHHRILSEPLTHEFLKCLDLSEQASAVLDEVQDRAQANDEEQVKRKREEAQIKNRLANLENYLGAADPDLEESYRRQIKQVKAQLQALQQKPLPQPISAVDLKRVRYFLNHLETEWQRFSPRLRNRLLKILIERVEISHDRQQIQAIVYWKMGFYQKLVIERPLGNSAREKWWTAEQDQLLREIWPTATREELLVAFPNRAWRAIVTRASNLDLKRQVRHYPPRWKPWTAEDDALLVKLYVKSSTEAVAQQLSRSIQAVASRASFLRVAKPRELIFPIPQPVWETYNDYGLDGLCSWSPPNPSA